HVWLEPEDTLVQVELAQHLAGHVADVYLGHGVLRLLRINSSPFRAPGTAPLSASKLRSGSTCITSRFCTVMRSPPMRPAMRMPLNTRPGVVPLPTEPGAPWRSDWPWVLGPPRKPWRFTTPAKPCPFEVPVTSTSSPGVSMLTSILVP